MRVIAVQLWTDSETHSCSRGSPTQSLGLHAFVWLDIKVMEHSEENLARFVEFGYF